MIKLLICDIDGTLLNRQHQLTPQVKEAIFTLRKSGVHFMPASGRDYESIITVLEEIEFSTCICLNGGEYRNNDGALLSRYAFSNETFASVLEKILAHRIDCIYYSDQGKFALKPNEEIVALFLERLNAIEDQPSFKWEQVNAFFSTTKQTTLTHLQTCEVCKVEMILDNPNELSTLKEQFSQMEEVVVSSSHPLNIELNAKQATKGKMVERVCELYGFQKDEIVVVGDGNNDLSMLSTFPNSYAMGQASEEVKQAAKHVLPSHDNDGVAHLIKKILHQNHTWKNM